MKCESCESRNAKVHLTQIVNNEISTLNLCEQCASEKGIDTGVSPASAPLSDFLAQMGEELGAEELPDEGECPLCGLTVSDFKKTGRLGCFECYDYFSRHLRNLLRRLHGASQHVGKAYLPPDPTLADHTARLTSMRRRLQKAIENEDFERAAMVRDDIHELEQSLGDREVSAPK
ncbi:MAG: UvrB/UvrC motif-containing protein [Longimicrobiaceae bacterium]